MDITSSPKWKELTRKIGVIEDKETYQEALALFYKEFSQDMLDTNVILDFLNTFKLDEQLNLDYWKVKDDLLILEREKEIGIITDKESYKKALEKCYEISGSIMFNEGWIQKYFIDVYELDTVLHINNEDVYNDLNKLKLTGTIGTITDRSSYGTALVLYSAKYNDMFDEESIQLFINTYELDTVLHIGFNDVCIDLFKLLLEIRKNVKVITDNHTYFEALELLYFNFDDIIIFDEEFICKFINAYHLDTRFNISSNDVWNDLAKIKRQSELEDKILDEIDTVEDIESYKEALELYYNVFGENMFEIDKVQRFIDTFELYNIDITPNTVYRDLRAIKSAFGSRNEISQSNFTSLHPDIKPAETITLPVQTQSTQVQTTNTIQPEEDDHDYLEKSDVDKDFGKKVDRHEAFYFYVTNMSDTELINTINNQYKNIKGSWTLVPRMGEYGSVEFAVVLLLWKYAVNNFSKNPESYASLQIMLGDVICCAFFGMSAGEWSDKVDPIINAHTDIVSYEEFGDVYNYLRNNYIDKIHSLEFNDGNMQDEVYKQLYAKFIEIYNSTNEFSEMLDFYTSKGLKIKDDIHFNIANDKNDNLNNLLVREWKSDRGYFEEDGDIQQLPPLLTDKFYISSYRCPICGRHVYKTVFPIGGEFPIRTSNGYISMKRIFTCKTCLRFFTPLPGHKLSYGQYYFLRLETLDEYKMLLETYDEHGTTDGRPDA